MKSDFYVYAYYRDESDEINDVPLYIGMGRGRRWESHLKRSTNIHLQRIISNSGETPHKKLRDGLTHQEAVDLEVALIKRYGRFPNGPLCNFTDGGEGTPGHVKSKEWREHQSAVLTGRTRSEDAKRSAAEKHRGMKRSADTKRLISLSRVGLVLSDETRSKMSKVRRGRPHSDEHRQALKEAWVRRKARHSPTRVGAHQESPSVR